MFNPNKITKILGATFILVSSNAALAATAPGTVTVTVQNTFNLTETTALDFGTIRAVGDASNAANFASLVLAPDGGVTTAQVGASAITSLSTPTAAVFTVDSAAPFTDLTVTFPPDFTLTTTGVPSGAAVFQIAQADWLGTIVGGADDGTTIATAGVMETDNLGGVVLNVGTTLTTDKGAAFTSGYVDQAYTGTYTMTVAY
ncbi:hypothetical protein [Paraglaciecola arctica]|uniref:hypothetical protein n=1 Tax=Paraglaciecola arctica TaxID=1128911 RepID=UPI001C077801|nr:hypothetical protein [Paraglaciecola arctica]MBU3003034.1 hypothetical protein [Paraglaciecola arctica]